MSFIQRELDMIARQLSTEEVDSPVWKALYAAQQALAWALDPQAVKSPYRMIMGIPADSGDYYAGNCPPPLPDMAATTADAS